MPRKPKPGESSEIGDEVPRRRHGHPSGDSAAVEEGGRGLDFTDAAAIIEGSLGYEGTDAWTPVGFARRRDSEIATLAALANEIGLWVSETRLAGMERGRMEHDLVYVGNPPHRVMKVTRWPNFGFYPHCDPSLVSGMASDWFALRPGTPLQYLRRMALTDELFPALEHCLEGFVMLNGKFRVVISQRFIEPVAASPRAIAAFFTEAGFEQLLAEAWYRAADNVAVFDASPTNLLEFSAHLFPIDILPVRPNSIMLERIQEALRFPLRSR